jgi:succinate dehydrogenase / fumarate reductase cytochrome b subunit
LPQNNRPLSPHLQVYKPQLTSVLSIIHRGTGMVITLGALTIALWLWGMALSAASYASISGFLDSAFGKILMIAWTFCTSYHLLNGIRHLVWDYGYGFELDQVYLSGKLVVVGAFVLTLLVWIL